jgi:lysophospholipase L1-like esterase/dienelactone hydrolase
MKQLIILLCIYSSAVTAQIKVACIGASITYGATVPDREHNSFPAQLQTLLGSKYAVANYGVSGATLLNKGDHPYTAASEYRQALQSNPDIVFIDLGGNDAKLVNRVHMDECEADYRALIRSFAQLPSHPRIILLGPVVSFVTDTTGIWDAVIVKQVIPHMQNVALQEGLEMLDMHPLLVNRPELFPDKIHPNTEGSGIMAKRLYDQLQVQQDRAFDIFNRLTVPKTISAFNGYACADFKLDNHACKVVKPRYAAKGHPWIWRARFWGHEPQTDIALLERGFHVVYCDVAELLGNREAIQTWNRFYHLVNKAGLAHKAAMEGMSRGGVYVFNWAAENPDKVACVYVDNPVLDLKSWPGGLGRNKPDPGVLPQMKADYHITTGAQLQQFKGSPVDKVKDIVKGKYPILILCADADEAVPPAENTLLFERKVKALHGQITVMHKPGFKHHPHSLPNPSPIVEFTLSATTHALFIVQ